MASPRCFLPTRCALAAGPSGTERSVSDGWTKGHSSLTSLALLSSRTDALVVAWCTSNATYWFVRFMRAAPCCGPRLHGNSKGRALNMR